jgi:hypothetical protein
MVQQPLYGLWTGDQPLCLLIHYVSCLVCANRVEITALIVSSTVINVRVVTGMCLHPWYPSLLPRNGRLVDSVTLGNVFR